MQIPREALIGRIASTKHRAVAFSMALALAAALEACSGNSGSVLTAIDQGTTTGASADIRLAPSPAATSDPIQPPSTGAYFGAWVAPTGSSTDDELAIEALEATFSQRSRLALHMDYEGFQTKFSSDPSIGKDIAHGRAPVISWGCSNTHTGKDELALIINSKDDLILKNETTLLRARSPVTGCSCAGSGNSTSALRRIPTVFGPMAIAASKTVRPPMQKRRMSL